MKLQQAGRADPSASIPDDGNGSEFQNSSWKHQSPFTVRFSISLQISLVFVVLVASLTRSVSDVPPAQNLSEYSPTELDYRRRFVWHASHDDRRRVRFVSRLGRRCVIHCRRILFVGGWIHLV